MELTFKEIVGEKFDTRSKFDHRCKVNKIIIAYTGEDKAEYRKSFEFPVDTSYDTMLQAYPRIVIQ